MSITTSESAETRTWNRFVAKSPKRLAACLSFSRPKLFRQTCSPRSPWQQTILIAFPPSYQLPPQTISVGLSNMNRSLTRKNPTTPTTDTPSQANISHASQTCGLSIHGQDSMTSTPLIPLPSLTESTIVLWRPA